MTDNNNRPRQTVAMVLCFFLGMIGAHRFYTGNKGSGVAILLLSITGVGAVISLPWIIVDFFRILTGSFRDGDGRPLLR